MISWAHCFGFRTGATNEGKVKVMKSTPNFMNDGAKRKWKRSES